jgi:pilus assembly protein CpaE
VPRSAVAIALPRDEFPSLQGPFAEAGYEAISVKTPDELESLLKKRSHVHCAILDGENDFDATLEMYGVLHEADRNIPALIVMPSHALGQLGLGGRSDSRDEYLTRPYSPESLRWRVEAMLIRVESGQEQALSSGRVGESGRGFGASESEATGTGLIGASGSAGVATEEGATRGRIIIVFNPKGGVGKTTISINLASALQTRKGQRVLLVDCDTITGHVASSLGLHQPRTLAKAWEEPDTAGATQTLAEIATIHSSGIGVLVMAASPLHTEVLDPKRVADSIVAARDFFDWVILDMHPDYGPLNQALFEQADKILVPVTPDVPCIRAAVQFREVAIELGIRDHLSLVINRANSGVSASDVERVVGIRALARVRSAGLLFVRASNEGQSAVERFPTAKVVNDIENLADRLIADLNVTIDATKPGVRQRNRLVESFRGFFRRISAQVS